MAHSFTNLLYHIVFSTKDRRPLITTEIEPRLYQYLGGVIRKEDGITIEINGTQNHIHILAKLRQDKALSEIMRSVKANTSKWGKSTFSNNQAFAWQSGYGAFTVSESQVEKVCQYIQNQETHHKKTTFEEEFTALLKAHGISFDPKYLWT